MLGDKHIQTTAQHFSAGRKDIFFAGVKKPQKSLEEKRPSPLASIDVSKSKA